MPPKDLEMTMSTRQEPLDRMAPPPALLTVAQAAERLALGRTTVFGLCMSGVLRSVKIGRSRRIPADAIEEFIATLERQSN
jgi:excisionase family DNA binding protein